MSQNISTPSANSTPLRDDMTNSVFEALFGDQWDKMFNDAGSFFGTLLQHVNLFAVTLIVIITLFTVFSGLFRLGQKEEFLGKGRSVSFWILRLVLFIGCCYPAMHGYSIAQAMLLKVGVRYSADVGNKIAEQAFETMANTGMLPIGQPYAITDNTLMYKVFDNAVCHAYMKNELSRSKKKQVAEDPYYWGGKTGFGNGIQIKGIDHNTVQTQLWGARWGGKSDSRTFATNICGQILYACNVGNVADSSKLAKSGGIKNSQPLPSDASITINKEKKYDDLKSDIISRSQEYCNAHGKLFERKIKEVTPIAEALVTGNNPKRGEVERLQKEYENEVAIISQNLRNSLTTHLQDTINDAGITRQIQTNGFMMLGFYYYQLNSLIDEARDIVSIKPSIIYPQYDKIDPNLNESKGLGSYMLMAESYRNSTCEPEQANGANDCIFDANIKNYTPERDDNYVMKKLGPYVSPKTFWALFNTMDAERPVSSILDLGSNMINTGATITTVFVGFDVLSHGAASSWLGKVGDATGIKGGFLRLLSWIAVGIISLSIYLIICGIFLFFVIPTIPLVTWLFAIFGWIIIVLETIVAIPFWAVAASTSTGDGFVADTGRTGLTLFLNVVIRPILLPVFFFFAIAVAVVFSKLILAGLDIYIAGQTADTWSFTPTGLFTWLWRIFLATYLFVMAFKLSHEMMAKSYDYVMRFVNSMGRADYSTDAPNSDMMGKGMAFASGAGAAASMPVAGSKQALTEKLSKYKGKGADSSPAKNSLTSNATKLPEKTSGDNDPRPE